MVVEEVGAALKDEKVVPILEKDEVIMVMGLPSERERESRRHS